MIYVGLQGASRKAEEMHQVARSYWMAKRDSENMSKKRDLREVELEELRRKVKCKTQHVAKLKEEQEAINKRTQEALASYNRLVGQKTLQKKELQELRVKADVFNKTIAKTRETVNETDMLATHAEDQYRQVMQEYHILRYSQQTILSCVFTM